MKLVTAIPKLKKIHCNLVQTVVRGRYYPDRGNFLSCPPLSGQGMPLPIPDRIGIRSGQDSEMDFENIGDSSYKPQYFTIFQVFLIFHDDVDPARYLTYITNDA